MALPLFENRQPRQSVKLTRPLIKGWLWGGFRDGGWRRGCIIFHSARTWPVDIFRRSRSRAHPCCNFYGVFWILKCVALWFFSQIVLNETWSKLNQIIETSCSKVGIPFRMNDNVRKIIPRRVYRPLNNWFRLLNLIFTVSLTMVVFKTRNRHFLNIETMYLSLIGIG